MAIRIFSASIQGIDAQRIDVEVDSSPGLHNLTIVGLPDKAVEESKDRITAAIRNSGFLPPSAHHKKVIVNLAPADIRKEGPSYDLPIAIAYLLESRQIEFNPTGKIFVGEVSLDGSLKKINGVLPIAIMAKEQGFEELWVPHENRNEAAIIDGLKVYAAKNLMEIISHLDSTSPLPIVKKLPEKSIKSQNISFLSIMGQAFAKRALVVAAAGSHNILMSGAPGSGKTILAKSLQELLPPMSFTEAVEVAKIYSSIGLFNGGSLSLERPFRNPHHNTSAPAVIGGGSWPRPGEISLAHRGVLFLDELPEFPRNVLESLRQPLEEGVVTVSRVSGSLLLPAKFMFVAAMNPCPCGNYGDEKAICSCPPYNVIKYRKKVSGPLLDRIDVQIQVSREKVDEQKIPTTQGDFQNMRDSIQNARKIQAERYRDSGILTNSEISFKNIDKFCQSTPEASALLKDVVNAKNLSFRTFHKIKKLSRTLADLEGSEIVTEKNIAEAINLRVNEKLFLAA
ncbi:MAG: magnesium chelatase [Candidatus Yanofskybacteria bacterium RIFCSPLOWO2_12_FULL_44_13b]|nr:MAG: magnesium chelatase [Candidatus Yanofskybacteria bacterium RIFCSPLOWO2_12_FULL_44_13b]